MICNQMKSAFLCLYICAVGTVTYGKYVTLYGTQIWTLGGGRAGVVPEPEMNFRYKRAQD